MKIVFYFSVVLIALSSCDTIAPEQVAGQTDTAAIKNVLPDSVPREVMKGKGGDWSYRPDSCFNELVLGSAPSFSEFWKKNGANMQTLEGKRKVTTYFNSQKTEWMAVYTTQNSKGKDLAYGVVVQKAGAPGSPAMPFPGKAEFLSKANVITGHGIYIGMSPDYVLSIYTDQKLTQWEKGDTLYFTYEPKEKDAKYFPYYDWKNYKATYKFVNDRLRRMEYFADPAELEKR